MHWRTGSGAVEGKSFKFTGLYFCVPLTSATMLPTGTVQTLSWSMSVTGAFCKKVRMSSVADDKWWCFLVYL